MFAFALSCDFGNSTRRQARQALVVTILEVAASASPKGTELDPNS